MALFVQAMLSKVDDTASSYLWKKENIYQSSITVPEYSTKTLFNQTITDALIWFKVKITSSTNDWYAITYVNGTQRQNYHFYTLWGTSDYVELPGNTGDVLKTDINRNGSGTITTNATLYYYTLSQIPIYKTYTHFWKPRELKIIGKKVSTTLFWVHTDNSRVTQDAE